MFFSLARCRKVISTLAGLMLSRSTSLMRNSRSSLVFSNILCLVSRMLLYFWDWAGFYFRADPYTRSYYSPMAYRSPVLRLFY